MSTRHLLLSLLLLAALTARPEAQAQATEAGSGTEPTSAPATEQPVAESASADDQSAAAPDADQSAMAPDTDQTAAAPDADQSAMAPDADQTAAASDADQSAAAPAPEAPAVTEQPAAAPAADQAAPAPAAVAAPAAAPAAGAEATADDGSVTATGTDETGAGTLTVDFPDQEIRTILRQVADLFELNIVIPETLQGTTSIKLRDVTWRQIFKAVLDPVGYTFVEDDNIIKIVSNESLQQEPVQTEVIVLNYADAADVLPSIQPLINTANGGGVVVDTRSNALVVTETPTRLAKIHPIIDALDHATEQVMIEAKFIEVTDGDVRDLGVNMSALRNYAVGVQPKADMTRTRGQDFSSGTDATSRDTGQTTDTNNTSTITPPGSTSSTISSVVAGTTSTALNLLESLTNTGSTERNFSAVFTADQFGVVLSALNTLSSTRVISNPTIVTLNNTEAEINVGREDPLPSYSYNEQRGSFEVSGFEYKPIGIILKVKPQVNARGFITLSVSPEVSQRNGSVNFGGAGGAEIPIIATRKATTTVSLKDGWTMGIGGLLTSEDTRSNTKVPLMSDIPLLGNLFKQKSQNKTTTNLLIFITAKTVAADGAPIEQVFDSRQIRNLGITRDELPGYRDGSDPFAPAPEGEPPMQEMAPLTQ